MIRKILIAAIVLVGAVLSGAIIRAAFQPKPIIWSPSYQSFDKQPYGGSIIVKQLEHFFPGKRVKRMGKDDLDVYYPYSLDIGDEALDALLAYEDSTLLLETYYEDYQEHFNFIGLAHSFYLSNRDSKALLMHLFQGNHALIVAQDLDGPLTYYTGIEYEMMDLEDSTSSKEQFTISINDNDPQVVKPYNELTRITSFPDSAVVVAKNNAGNVLGIKLKVGEGSLTYFSMPIVFSNYYILKDNAQPAEQLVASLPLEDTNWANYFTGGTYKFPQNRSILDFIHKQEPLTWAFYTLIFSVILFFLFKIKREQRAIPVVEPPRNVSLKFTETISNLYLLHGNNKELTAKKMSFFLEELRTRHNIDTHQLDTRFFKRVATKFDVRVTLPKHIFELYDKMMKSDAVSDDEFLRFNNLIQTFKHKKNG